MPPSPVPASPAASSYATSTYSDGSPPSHDQNEAMDLLSQAMPNITEEDLLNGIPNDYIPDIGGSVLVEHIPQMDASNAIPTAFLRWVKFFFISFFFKTSTTTSRDMTL